ncbi:hypothetical protein PFISCL1PPCAC_25497 [Pristionchus fissidentatus]|uniref:Uncharacterized protein n=1 Tax=Pristionchus fissidentatus TaxID=1538716 RepID=A0AAV5WUH4_9BILA|nr:hypothetical protein PFISCL1PPCAC_25497 [Pristionchus fissidentatus]
MAGKGPLPNPIPPQPLMTQNGAAMMMQQHQQMMYTGGYQQVPPSPYPSAPPTPCLAPMGAMPPHTPMYHAPPPTPMYPGAGYASGSSTPVHPNARSPARNRKATQGISVAASWMAQRGHLSAPGTPGPGSTYSPAGSVMSQAYSTMTGMNDDAMSVVSAVDGANLVELQPVVSHQTENIDPAQTNAIMQEAIAAATALGGPQQEQWTPAANAIYNMFRRVSPSQLHKEALATVVTNVCKAVHVVGSKAPDSVEEKLRALELRNRLFGILHQVSSSNRATRELMITVGSGTLGFQLFVQHTLHAMSDEPSHRDLMPVNNRLFLRAVAVLTNLLRDEGTEYYKGLVLMLKEDDNFFHYLFKRMINTQKPTAIELLCRMLRFGNRIKYRLKISQDSVMYLVNGTATHEGVFRRYLRKEEKNRKEEQSTIHNVLGITELLVRNDSARPTAHDDAIQKAFIDQNIFHYLERCMKLENPKLIDTALKAYANLASSRHLPDPMAADMARVMVEKCLHRRETKMQCAVIYTLTTVSRNRPDILRCIVDTQGFNYACHLINNYANQESLMGERNGTFVELIGNALDLCVAALRLDANSPDRYAQLWSAKGEKAGNVHFLFKTEFCSSLLNILVCGGVALKTSAVQLMATASLQHPFPADRFWPLLTEAHDSLPERRENISLALFNALNDSATTPSLALFRAAAELLALLVEEDMHATCLSVTARSHPNTQFPLNVLFCPALTTVTEQNQTTIEKLLKVCKHLVKDPELQQSWAAKRDNFMRLSMCGIYSIVQEAEEILNSLGTEGENDIYMSLASSFL